MLKLGVAQSLAGVMARGNLLGGTKPVAAVAQRRDKRPSSSAALGEAVCKKYRAGREVLIASINGCAPRKMAGDSQVARKISQAGLRPEAALPALALEGPAAAQLRPLPPPPPVRSPLGLLEEPTRPLWELSAWSTRSADGQVTRPSKTGFLEYLAYLDHLQAALPGAELRPVEDDLESQEEEAWTQVTGLELLRRLTEKAKARLPRWGITPLSPEEMAIGEEALWGSGSPTEVVASRFSVDLTRGKMECLRPGTWLNDEVINFYFKLLQERSKVIEGNPKCWFANSFFWQKLGGQTSTQYNFTEVRRWTVKAKVNIFEMDYVIFPMNIGETHWAMGAIDIKEKGFRYYDSMISRPHPNFVPFLRKYLEDEHKARNQGRVLEGVESWDLIVTKVPQQRNGYDCGVFTCFFADRFSARKELSFSQDDMPNLRLRLAARVLKADENWPED